ncbi:MAG TPA: CPBP family intramembrane glutamic endopeptidase [Candidatus Limnocylindrales bacterium]|nr:CPBP family intramembrane glutamic endopeptidase [Candidatus Limnocylindrales bacterium]
MLIRLLPFTVLYSVAWVATRRAGWLGLTAGDVTAQLIFAAAAIPTLFAAATTVQLWLTRRRGALNVPAGPGDAWFQAAFYGLNGPIEEAFFRGLMQGGLTALWGAPVGFAIATTVYVLYHRLGRWSWPDTVATSLLGVPLGLAFWLLPGPPSLLGISLAHIAATCGFLGPGPYLLRRLRLL